ncbi:MAG TPA: cytochrome c [Usitatibacter sp.]|nr:cytochrome c [Usitatibacter sp.]
MKRIVKGLLLGAIALACASAFAASGDPEAGMKKSAPCQACHGPKGISVSPEFPNLAGQQEDYIIASLHHYKDGHRKNPIMVGQAANLTERDIRDIAAYFSEQKGLYVKD